MTQLASTRSAPGVDRDPAGALPAEVITALPRLAGPAVVAVGTFDGVHHGHRELLRSARAVAQAVAAQTIAVTFDPRPDRLFSPRTALPDICTVDERVARLYDAGADRVIVLPFSRALAAVDAPDFVAVLQARLRMVTLCVGEDFALGRGREGTPEHLRRLGLDVVTVPTRPSAATEEKASSSHARRLIAAGMPAELALRLA